MKKIFLVGLALIFIVIPLSAFARIYILIDEASQKKFPVAVPEFLNAFGATSTEGKEMTDLLKKDLNIAGYFKVLDEAAFLSHEPENSEQIDFSRWTAIDAHALVKGIIDTRSGGRMMIELRLYDTDSHELLVGKQYTVDKKNVAPAIHRFVDELMASLTGKLGPFSSQITAACGRNGARQIVVFSIDGTGLYTATKNKSNNISPNWSPDGGSIAFTSFLRRFPEIYSVDSGGGTPKQLTSNGATNITPAFSPSGNSIAFSSSFSGDAELYLMSPSGHITQKLTSVINIDLAPAWSPDGQKIAFASERAGNLHLFAMGADGSSPQRLTYTGYQNDQPDWSPDGQKIVFTSRDRGAFDIFSMNADGSLIQRITRDEGNNESPTWSPDSRYISFSRGNNGVYVMLADGNNQTLIPDTAGCINPDWGPQIR